MVPPPAWLGWPRPFLHLLQMLTSILWDYQSAPTCMSLQILICKYAASYKALKAARDAKARGQVCYEQKDAAAASTSDDTGLYLSSPSAPQGSAPLSSSMLTPGQLQLCSLQTQGPEPTIGCAVDPPCGRTISECSIQQCFLLQQTNS